MLLLEDRNARAVHPMTDREKEHHSGEKEDREVHRTHPRHACGTEERFADFRGVRFPNFRRGGEKLVLDAGKMPF